MVEGAAGNGKSALLAATAASTRPRPGCGCCVRVVANWRRGLAFGVIRQLFERVVAAAAPAERADLLAGAAAPAERVLALDGSLRDTPPSAAGAASPRCTGSTGS